MLTLLSGYSLEPPPSEVEFLRRELGIQWQQVTAEEMRALTQQHSRLLLLISEPDHYRDIVHSSADESLVVFMISDEGYSLERLDLARSPSIARIYRHYPAQPASWIRIIQAAAGYVRDARGTSQSPKTVLPNVASGLTLRRRMKEWASLGDRLQAVPLGYTDTFAHAFAERMQLAPNESFFAAPISEEPRPISIAFRGNRGLAQRIVGIERAQRIPNADISTVDADWSGRAEGDVGDSYVQSLLAARFALCPPGFANNESFRFYEALICGALPVEIATATTHLGELPWRSRHINSAPSWATSLRAIDGMPEASRLRKLSEARTPFRRAISLSTRAIRGDVGK